MSNGPVTVATGKLSVVFVAAGPGDSCLEQEIGKLLPEEADFSACRLSSISISRIREKCDLLIIPAAVDCRHHLNRLRNIFPGVPVLVLTEGKRLLEPLNGDSPSEPHLLYDFLSIESLSREQLGFAVRNLTRQARLLRELENVRSQASLAREQLESLVEKNADGILVQDAKGRVVYLNAAAAEILDRGKEKLVGRPLGFQLVNGQVKVIEIPSARGEVRIVELHATGASWNGDRATLVALRDLTEQKNLEKKLRITDEEKDLILNSMSEIVIHFDSRGRINWANAAADRLNDKAGEELKDHPCFDGNGRGRTYCPGCPVRKVLDTGESRDTEMIKPSGRVYQCRGYPVHDNQGEVQGVVLVAKDITGSRRTEEALRKSERKFRNVFRQSLDGIAVTDEEGSIVEWNERLEQYTGLKKNLVLGQPVWLVACSAMPAEMQEKTGGGDVEREIKKALKTGKGEWLGMPREMALVTANDQLRYFQVQTFPIRTERGFMLGIVARDITERRQLEEERLKASKLESLGVLAGGLAHDFNNILTSIMGNINLAKICMDNPDKVTELMAEAERASLRAKGLTQQLLTFSKGGAPVKKVIRIGYLLREASTIVLRGSNVRSEFDIVRELWPVEVDEDQMSQVIHNLVINADQAMGDGGTLRISAHNLDTPEEPSPGVPAGRWVKIGLEDNGPGIPEEIMAKVFDPYFTTKENGNGLGLTTAYSIIKRHGGHLLAEAGQQGHGTTMTIYLPSAEPDAGEQDRQPPPGKCEAGGRVLVLDDEQIVREVLTQMLGYLGYCPDTVCEGSEAVRQYREAREKNMPYDMVLFDLTIPGGMGGLEALEKIREIDPDVVAVVASGYSNDPVMADYEKYGFRARINKPFKIDELADVMKSLVAAGEE